jgi:putative addiction module component (TIGR02574 family)
MPKGFDEMTKDLLELPLQQRLALAEVLLESADQSGEPEAAAAWDAEIRDRIRAIDQGHVTGIAFEDVMQAADRHLAR